MPVWNNAPPQNTTGHPLRIVRTPATGKIKAVVTSDDVHGCPTHYISNRTIPCEGLPDCPACNQGHSWRWHGYVSCILTTTYEHVLFEFTATASDSFRNYRKIKDHLRSCLFEAKRPSGKTNGRVIISCSPFDDVQQRLPEPPNIERILCHIWGIQYVDPGIIPMTRPPFKAIKVPRDNGDARNKPNDGPDDAA